MSKTIQIGEQTVGAAAPAFIVAEVAQAHDGSLGAAHVFIDAAADAGADAIKFQTHFASEESTLDEPFRVKFSRQDETRYGYWQRMEFSDEQWAGLSEHARERGITFLSSAFSLRAVELLDRLGVAAWKIASGEVESESLQEAMIGTKKPLILSSGMSSWAEIDGQVGRLRQAGAEIAILQCTTRYPTSLEEVGLNVMDEMRRLDCPVGLSDHTGTPYPVLAALAQGADLVEFHIVLDKRQFGPDTGSSLTIEQLSEIVRARDAFHTMATHPVNKDEMADALAPTRAIFSQSLAPVRDLKAGDLLTREMIGLRKPGTGIPESRLKEFVGRRLARDVDSRRIFRLEDFEQ